MSDRAEIRRLLLRSRREAEGHMEAIRSVSPLSYARLHAELTGYILVKFLLTEDDLPESGSFDALVELSLAKSMKVSPALVEEFDTAQSCDGATSAMAKKVLLFRSIERALDLELPAMESATAKTMHDLSGMLYRTMKSDPRYAERLTD